MLENLLEKVEQRLIQLRSTHPNLNICTTNLRNLPGLSRIEKIAGSIAALHQITDDSTLRLAGLTNRLATLWLLIIYPAKLPVIHIAGCIIHREIQGVQHDRQKVF